MATAFHVAPKRARISSRYHNGTEVNKMGKEKAIPWEIICSESSATWLDVYAKANNTSRDLLLASILPTVACLMGETTVKVDCKLRNEQINLFVICLSAPGSGKSPSFQNGCSQPIRLHVEDQASTALFVDEFTEAGLFKQLKSSAGHKAIIGKEEVSLFFDQILHGAKERSRVDVERLIQLYDGATWVYTKGDKSSRQIVQNPGVSIVGYSQPERFFPLYVKLKERRDGAVDRMLVYQPMPKRLTSTETKEYIVKLMQAPVKDLRSIYEGIYSFCHSENDVLSLSLDALANKAFETFVDKIAATLNKQWAENRTNEDVSKDDRHVLRLAAVLHVFFDQLEKKLHLQPASPPTTMITSGTIHQAIALTNYFAEQRKVLDQLGDISGGDESGHQENIAKAILTCSGPFATMRLTQCSFNGKNRPVASTVLEVMGNIEKDGLGKVMVIERTSVLYKCLPCTATDEALESYHVDRDVYLEKFKERASSNQISKDLFNRLLNKAPKKDDLDIVYGITEEM